MQCTLDNVHSMLGWYCKGKVQGGHCLGGAGLGGGHVGESRSGILIALHTLLAALTYITPLMRMRIWLSRHSHASQLLLLAVFNAH